MITQVDSGRDDYFNTKKDAFASFFMPINNNVKKRETRSRPSPSNLRLVSIIILQSPCKLWFLPSPHKFQAAT